MKLNGILFNSGFNVFLNSNKVDKILYEIYNNNKFQSDYFISK